MATDDPLVAKVRVMTHFFKTHRNRNKANTTKKHRKARRRLNSIERIEDRILMAADVAVIDDTLQIIGDDAANDVEIHFVTTDVGTTLEVQADGEFHSFEQSEVSQVSIELNGGDDQVRYTGTFEGDREKPKLRNEINTGSGNDRVSIGEAIDVQLSVDVGEGSDEFSYPRDDINTDGIADDQEVITIRADQGENSVVIGSSLNVVDFDLQPTETLVSEVSSGIDEFDAQQQSLDRSIELAERRLREAEELVEAEFLAPARQLAEANPDNPPSDEIQSLQARADAVLDSLQTELETLRDQKNLAADRFDAAQSDLTAKIDSTLLALDAHEVDPVPLFQTACQLAYEPHFTVYISGSVTYSGGLNLQVIGFGGGNTIQTGSGHDTIFSGSGADIVWSGAGNDRIDGQAGADRLFGQTGNDCVYGGPQADWVVGNSGSDELHGGADRDIILGYDGIDYMYGDGGHDLMWGGRDNDFMRGGDGLDYMLGSDGFDQMHGDNDRDWMRGNDGSDFLSGGRGNDLMWGDNQRDVMVGGNDHDRIWGGNDGDWLLGNNGFDQIRGGNGGDFIDGGNDTDWLLGDADNDRILGGNAQDVMWGNGGNDRMYGGNGNDWMFGNSGNDCMQGDAGHDRMWGHSGADTMHGLGGNDWIWGLADNDRITDGSGWVRIRAGDGNDLVVLAADSQVDFVWGENGIDTMQGTANVDVFFSGPGPDTYHWAGGTPILIGSFNILDGPSPNQVSKCPYPWHHFADLNIGLASRAFEAAFTGLESDSIAFDNISGLISSDHYKASHGVTLENMKGIGVAHEGDPTSIETLDGYDGRLDGDNVLATHPNHIDPFTILFEEPVSAVGSFAGAGIQGDIETLTIQAFDKEGNTIGSQSVNLKPNQNADNREGHWLFTFDENVVSKVTIRNDNSTDFGNALIVDNITWGRMSPALQTDPDDINQDGVVDGADLDLLCSSVTTGEDDRAAVQGFLSRNNIPVGDSNFDGEFSSSDFVTVFAAGTYEVDVPATWSTGDWNCDGRFDSSDFVAAFAAGRYEQGPLQAIATFDPRHVVEGMKSEAKDRQARSLAERDRVFASLDAMFETDELANAFLA